MMKINWREQKKKKIDSDVLSIVKKKVNPVRLLIIINQNIVVGDKSVLMIRRDKRQFLTKDNFPLLICIVCRRKTLPY